MSRHWSNRLAVTGLERGAAYPPLEDTTLSLAGKEIDVVALDDALRELANIDARKAQAGAAFPLGT